MIVRSIKLTCHKKNKRNDTPPAALLSHRNHPSIHLSTSHPLGNSQIQACQVARWCRYGYHRATETEHGGSSCLADSFLICGQETVHLRSVWTSSGNNHKWCCSEWEMGIKDNIFTRIINAKWTIICLKLAWKQRCGLTCSWGLLHIHRKGRILRKGWWTAPSRAAELTMDGRGNKLPWCEGRTRCYDPTLPCLMDTRDHVVALTLQLEPPGHSNRCDL